MKKTTSIGRACTAPGGGGFRLTKLRIPPGARQNNALGAGVEPSVFAGAEQEPQRRPGAYQENQSHSLVCLITRRHTSLVCPQVRTRPRVPKKDFLSAGTDERLGKSWQGASPAAPFSFGGSRQKIAAGGDRNGILRMNRPGQMNQD